MSDIERIVCGAVARTFPDGRVTQEDYYELLVTNEHEASLNHRKNGNDDRYTLDETELETALEEIEALVAANPDVKPYPEQVPLVSTVFFRGGTEKYAPRDELSQILENMMLLQKYSSMDLQPQGLVAAPSTANGFFGMGMLMQPPPQPAEPMPMLQGLVAADRPPVPDAAEEWECPSCGHMNTGKFCAECGTPKPQKG
ncbi:MAG: hypothetical protein IKO47_04855 [Ruminococcus sp.]|nr:hypothetical protein [Ruminococcus sp.]